MCASSPLSATRIAILVAALAGTFVLGWWWGRSEPAGQPASPAAAPSTEPSVELRIDAGGISLLPDGGLYLKPLPPLDASDEAPDEAVDKPDGSG
jgi:hypothetical protein